ncbi:MAG TPA: hypothetical protein VHE11_10360, partial [Steroidobacteraceae bacterium]|nr:hypothetical protein [Steroidobacteraceae bacterium]
EGELRAVIPASYTASDYPLQYFFELRAGRNRAHRFPGFASDSGGQPYFLVRASRRISAGSQS